MYDVAGLWNPTRHYLAAVLLKVSADAVSRACTCTPRTEQLLQIPFEKVLLPCPDALLAVYK